MKKQTQEQQIRSMMKHPIPKKRVGIIKLKMIRESTVLYGTERFHKASDAAKMVRSIYRDADREIMVVMSLSASLTPIAIEIVAVGGLVACSIDTRDVFKHAILTNAAKIICFHNHPSGSLNVSRADSEVTAQMKEAGKLLGIELIDHIIIGYDEDYISFKESNMYPFDGEVA